MTNAYNAKVNELENADKANAEALAAHKTAYEAELALLKAADADNEAAIEALTNAYNAKVTALENADKANAEALAAHKSVYESKVMELNSKISANATAISALEAELESEINKLKVENQKEIDEINALILGLQNVDASNQAAIKALTDAYNAKMEELKELTDGYTQKITELEAELNELQSQHAHTFGEWRRYGYCDSGLNMRSCNECALVEFKNVPIKECMCATVTKEETCEEGGYVKEICSICGKVNKTLSETTATGHNYQTTLSHDSSYHWYECENCDIKKSYGEHVDNGNGLCSLCNTPSGPTKGVTYAISSDGTYAEVERYSGESTYVRISETFNDLPVRVIKESAFYQNTVIKKVIIPDGVDIIEKNAFSNCSNLTDIHIGDSVTEIEEYAFSNCYKLTSITIPDSVTSIGVSAFDECDSITSVTIGKGLKKIGFEAFDCTSITSVYITDIAKWCEIDFHYNSNPLNYGASLYLDEELVTELVIPDGVTSIKYQFSGCSSITSVMLPDTLANISYPAFYGCSNLQYNVYDNAKYLGSSKNPHLVLFESTDKNIESITIHDSTKIIAYNAFINCSSITSVTIPDSVKSIGESAFENCSGLKSVTIGNGVTSIDMGAFEGCTAITTITIGNNVTSIGKSAFLGCNSLTSIKFRGTDSQWLAIEKGKDWDFAIGKYTITYNYTGE